MDSTVVRAHQHVAGAKGQANEALGRSRGRFGTKVFVLTDRKRDEEVALERLMDGEKVKRRGGGRPKARPGRMVGDNG